MDRPACKKKGQDRWRSRVDKITSLPGHIVEGKALLVGQDMTMAHALGLALGLGGIRHRYVGGAAAATAAISGEPPSLVMLDSAIPDEGALDLCRRLKDDASTHHMPIFVVSRSADPADEVKAFEAGADGYFDCKVRPDVLVARARAAMRTCAFNRELRGRRHAMRSELDLVRQWSRYVVHDMQSPIMAALANTEFLRRSAETDVLREAVGDIEQSLRHLQRLARDLLDYDRLASGLIALDKKDVDLSVEADAVVAEAEALARCHGSSLQARGRGRASCDVVLVRRVLWNLIANALKFGGACGPVTIAVEQVGPGFPTRVTVTDRGPGVPEAMRARLFTLYGRDEQDPRPGHGLGLAFSRLVVEAHGGRIWMEDPPGGGAAFVFALPSD